MPQTPSPKPVDIIIPFYRNAGLVPPLLESLAAVKDELAAVGCSLVLVNDSPGDKVITVTLYMAKGGCVARFGFGQS